MGLLLAMGRVKGICALSTYLLSEHMMFLRVLASVDADSNVASLLAWRESLNMSCPFRSRHLQLTLRCIECLASLCSLPTKMSDLHVSLSAAWAVTLALC